MLMILQKYTKNRIFVLFLQKNWEILSEIRWQSWELRVESSEITLPLLISLSSINDKRKNDKLKINDKRKNW